MRSLRDLWPQYADSVAFYAVNTNPTEGIESLVEFAEEEGYPWPIAQPDAGVIPNLRIAIQSSKIAMDGDGTIVYREGMGRGDVEEWRELFERLAAG